MGCDEINPFEGFCEVHHVCFVFLEHDFVVEGRLKVEGMERIEKKN